MAYAATEFDIVQAHRQMGWRWFVLEAVLYIVSAGVYVCKYGTRRKPDRGVAT
jgi:predicted membrane channel-forming protein YqfA (hemolysin III family)